MARNKYPEETVKKILDASLHLFMTKGYDNTSIQDIIDSLGGLTKGAVYHHFNSKEEILKAVMEEMDKGAYRYLQSLKEDTSLSGYEKLHSLFLRISNQGEESFPEQTAPDMKKNPQMLSRHLAHVYDRIAPEFIQPMIEEGIADGSIKTEYPKELAEVISLLGVLWLNPLISGDDNSAGQTIGRLHFFENMMQRLGIEVTERGAGYEADK